VLRIFHCHCFEILILYSKVCYAVSLSGSDHLVSGIEASVQCSIKAQGSRLATFLTQAEIDAFGNLDGYSSDSYWIGMFRVKDFIFVSIEHISQYL
jgi:hypothetical protein